MFDVARYLDSLGMDSQPRSQGRYLYVDCPACGGSEPHLWINVGDGSPANRVDYGNADGSDCGVNIDPDGDLHGLAWGENIGWVNFDGGAMTTPRQPARIECPDPPAERRSRSRFRLPPPPACRLPSPRVRSIQRRGHPR